MVFKTKFEVEIKKEDMETLKKAFNLLDEMWCDIEDNLDTIPNEKYDDWCEIKTEISTAQNNLDCLYFSLKNRSDITFT